MNDLRRLVPVIENLDSAVVACVGDLMLDHFIYGEVNRISPEAPIPVLRIQSQQSMLGGMGNVVRNLGALGCGVRVFSATGDDPAGEEIASLLKTVPRCHPELVSESGRKTPVKVRYIAHGQQLLRADNETTRPLSSASLDAVLRSFSATVSGCSVVVLSDYAKGALAGTFASEFIAVAKAQGKPVVVDPKGRDYSRYQSATLIKPNLKELGEAAELPVSNTDEQRTAARKLIEQTGAAHILVTRGAAGMLLVSQDDSQFEVPALAREVFEVSGAGDTVASALAAAIGSGCSIADSVDIANIAAGIVVGKLGTAVVERAEIIHEIEHQSALLASGKILRPDQAKERVNAWRRMNCRIGFVFGTFDSLAMESLEELERLRTRCDRLVVGVKSDSAIRQTGGKEGAQDQRARAYMVSSTVFADAVVVGEDGAELMAVVRPDVVSEIRN